MTDIPFSTYTSCLKQMETRFSSPFIADLFNITFSKFRGIDKMQQRLKEQGIDMLVTAAGSQPNFGSRPRRFAGGGNLGPDRYFTLCSDEMDDSGTLRDELYSYFSGEAGIDVLILDQNIDTEIVADFVDRFNIPDDYPFMLLFYKLCRKTEETEQLISKHPDLRIGERVGVTYGLRQFRCDIDRIVDLRIPYVQDWFTRTFVDLELLNQNKPDAAFRFYPEKERINSFADLLPVIVSLEQGGGDVFSQAIGCWLRNNGAKGLIFPSARANSTNRIVDGKLIESRGWNFVLYDNAAPPDTGDLFGRKAVWKDPDHDHIRVNFTDQGNEHGSFSIRGVKEYNLLNFDLENQIANGLREDNPVASMVGVTQANLSAQTNRILDKQLEAGSLWYKDFDTTQFISWHKDVWDQPV